MKKQFYDENELNKIFSWNTFNTLKEVKLSKGESIYSGPAFFILKGSVDVLFIDMNGESVKLRTVTSKEVIIGIINLFSKSIDTFHYTAKEDTVLIKLSPNDIEENKINNFIFLKFILETLGKHVKSFTRIAILTNNYSNQIKLKFLLKQEMDIHNIVNLKNPGKFIEQYNFSRTTFYRELKILENSGWLTRSGTLIKVNGHTS